MKELADKDLVEIGYKAAGAVPGLGTVDRVKVRVGEDSTAVPTYFFSFLIDRDRDLSQRGLTLIRLTQRLRDEITAREDDHIPFVQIMSQADWEMVEGA
jgi:hypothetical protein